MSTTYISENLAGGEFTTQTGKFAADTYYPGMPLEYDAANDRYQYLNAGDIAGFFWEPESRAILADGYGTFMDGGEIQQQGIVTDAGAAYTITEDLIAAWSVRGFKVKRN